jgi:CRISPR-associated endonuclease/helicase Cas3
VPYVDPERRAVPHATAGQLLLRGWLGETHGWQSSQAEPYAVVVGGHHGVPPTHEQLLAARDRARLLGWDAGQGLWRSVQRELLDRAARAHGIIGRLGELADARLPPPVQVLLTAIVIVADWIASNDALFPYETAAEPTAARVGAAWSALDLPAPWRAVAESGSAESLLAARFALGEGAVCRPVQTLASNLPGA